MSLRHLYKDLNHLGVYPDVYMSMGGADLNSEGKYPCIKWEILLFPGMSDQATYRSDFNRYTLNIGCGTRSYVILHNNKKTWTLSSHNIPRNTNWRKLAIFILFNKYKIGSRKDLERYVSKWLEKQ